MPAMQRTTEKTGAADRAWRWMELKLRLRKWEPWLMGGCVSLVAVGAILTAVAGAAWLQRTAHAQTKAYAKDDARTAPVTAGQPTTGQTKTTDDGAAGTCCESKKELEQQLANAEKEEKEKVEKEMERSKTLLDGQVALTGIYSVLLGLTAFMTVKFSRDDAKEQMDRAQETIKERLAEIQKKLDDVALTYPEFDRMDERVRAVLEKTRMLLPSEDDWNDLSQFKKIDTMRQQQILEAEMVVTAASVFALERSPGLQSTLFLIYANFARFHHARSAMSTHADDTEFARAIGFAGRAIQTDSNAASGYRLRGAIWLGGYLKLKDATDPGDVAERDQRLCRAEADLDEALKPQRSGTPDAGAYYNRSLAYYFRGDTASAIDKTEELLAIKDKVTPELRDRFMPYVYVNLGGFYAALAIEAAKAGQVQQAAVLSEKAVKAVAGGVTDLGAAGGSGRALERLKKQLRKELDDNQELNKLDAPYVKRLRDML